MTDKDKENEKVLEEAKVLHRTGVGGRLGLKGTFEWRDKDGNIVGIMKGEGSVPLSDLFAEEQPPQGGPKKFDIK